MNNRTVNVFVFGAGASSHVGLPIAKNLLIEGFNLLLITRQSVSFESFRKIANLIDTLYGTHIEANIQDRHPLSDLHLPSVKRKNLCEPSVTIEELLTFVELGISRQETWLHFEELRHALHDFIFETLDFFREKGSSDDFFPWNTDGSSNRRRNCYDILIDHILDLNHANCFISLNYDLFLDRAVAINDHDLLGDYGLNFSGQPENFSAYDQLTKGYSMGNAQVKI